MRVVKELEPVEVSGAIHPRRRLVVLLRNDGHFSVAEEYYYVTEHDGEIVAEGWQQHPARGLYATAEIAENEGRADFNRRHGLPR